MNAFRLGCAAAMAMLLAACANKTQDCPDAAALADASSLTAFKQGAPQDLSSILFNVQIVGVKSDCDVSKDTNTCDSSLDIKFRATRSPDGSEQAYSVPYFVVVAGPDNAIIAKNAYSVQFSFAPGQASTTFSDSVDSTVIKMAKGKRGYDYELYVGLQLTKAQMDYNRNLGRYAQ
ncbi:MAG TPA: hypothetical protein VH000_00320 [Rhizomicrobium sp.]|jgi:hypothetical protein|nr:hypothetical protein [Rhizomicrobium sp.]